MLNLKLKPHSDKGMMFE